MTTCGAYVNVDTWTETVNVVVNLRRVNGITVTHVSARRLSAENFKLS
jgi:hypothetical protein